MVTFLTHHIKERFYKPCMRKLDRWRRHVLRWRDANVAKLPPGATLQPCYSVDGTLVPIALPSIDQGLWYSGKSGQHCMNFQALVAPNGLAVFAHGPEPGSYHDAKAFRLSELPQRLARLHARMFQAAGGQLCGLADLAYPLSPDLITPFKRAGGAPLTPVQAAFNTEVIAPVRVSPEHYFGIVGSLWKRVDCKRGMQLYKQSVGNTYIAALMLTNCHACLYGNQISEAFQCEAPSMEDYLGDLTRLIPA